MRKAFTLSLLFTAGILFSNASYCSEKHATGDTTYIFVYRVGQFSGAGANWAVFLDEEKKAS